MTDSPTHHLSATDVTRILAAAAGKVADAKVRGNHNAVEVLRGLACAPHDLMREAFEDDDPSDRDDSPESLRANVEIAARATRAFADGDANVAADVLSVLPVEDALSGLLAFAAMVMQQRRVMPSLHESVIAAPGSAMSRAALA